MIVGGAGYFGARLAEALSAEAEITITFRTPSVIRDAWIAKTGLQSLRFDSATDDQLAVDGEFEAVINLATPGMAEAARDPTHGMSKGITTLRACLRLLEEGRARRLLHFSTFHVYGAGGRECYLETDTPSPISPYGQIHFECEKLALACDRALVLRPTNMVGRPAHAELGDQARMLFLDLCRQAASGTMKLNSDGLSHRDFMPFGDGIAAARLLLKTDFSEDRLFNIAQGRSISLAEAARLIQEAAGRNVTLEFGTGTDAYRRPFTVDTARIQKLGWQPRASLLEETRGLVNFFR